VTQRSAIIPSAPTCFSEKTGGYESIVSKAEKQKRWRAFSQRDVGHSLDSGQNLMPTDVAQVDVVFKFLQGHSNLYGNGDFLDWRILVLESLYSLVPQRWMVFVLEKQFQLLTNALLGLSVKAAQAFAKAG
jgi:hypothetical protein